MVVNYFISFYNNTQSTLYINDKEDFFLCILRGFFYIAACTLFGFSFFYVPMPISFSISTFS